MESGSWYTPDFFSADFSDPSSSAHVFIVNSPDFHFQTLFIRRAQRFSVSMNLGSVGCVLVSFFTLLFLVFLFPPTRHPFA